MIVSGEWQSCQSHRLGIPERLPMCKRILTYAILHLPLGVRFIFFSQARLGPGAGEAPKLVYVTDVLASLSQPADVLLVLKSMMISSIQGAFDP